MSEVPEWIIKQIQDARQLFGVGGIEWHITARLSDKPHGSDEFDGGCFIDSVYLNAEIEIKDNLENTERSRQTIYHEVLHVAHQEIDSVVRDLFKQAPKSSRRIYRKFYYEAVERFVQRTTRAICENLKAGESE